MPSGRRSLAAVFAHPDDEALFAGGLLAAAARSGARVRLLCLTRGEGGWSRFGERGQALAARRGMELRGACAALGIEPPDLLALPDGGLARIDADEATARIAAWLAASAPQVVVSFAQDGAYGHADHVACSRWVQSAVAAHGPDVRLLAARFAPDTFAAARRALARFVDATTLPVDAAQLGSPRATGDLRLPLDAELVERKRAAVAAHASQLPGGDPDRLLARGLLTSLCREEHYRVVLGPPFSRDQPHDPFEGLP